MTPNNSQAFSFHFPSLSPNPFLIRYARTSSHAPKRSSEAGGRPPVLLPLTAASEGRGGQRAQVKTNRKPIVGAVALHTIARPLASLP